MTSFLKHASVVNLMRVTPLYKIPLALLGDDEEQ